MDMRLSNSAFLLLKFLFPYFDNLIESYLSSYLDFIPPSFIQIFRHFIKTLNFIFLLNKTKYNLEKKLAKCIPPFSPNIM